LNGLPVIRFDGVDDFLTFTLPVNGLTGMTLFIVAANTPSQTVGSSRAERAALFWNETADWGTVYLSPFQSTVSFRFGTTQPSNAPLYSRPSSIGANFTVTAALKNGTNDSLYVNGALALSQVGKLSSLAGCQSTGNVGRGYNNNTYFAGDVAEVVVYNRALSASERQSVEQYVNSKYALGFVAPTSFLEAAPSLAPALRLERSPAGILRVYVVGQPGAGYALERSTDLITWTHLTTIILPDDSPSAWVNLPAANDACVFLRAR
jgi:hypothetical protein